MGLVERREEILKLLISRRKSTVPILMHEFHVSEKTIRRDIRALMLKYTLKLLAETVAEYRYRNGMLQIKICCQKKKLQFWKNCCKRRMYTKAEY